MERNVATPFCFSSNLASANVRAVCPSCRCRLGSWGSCFSSIVAIPTDRHSPRYWTSSSTGCLETKPGSLSSKSSRIRFVEYLSAVRRIEPSFPIADVPAPASSRISTQSSDCKKIALSFQSSRSLCAFTPERYSSHSRLYFPEDRVYFWLPY